MKNPARQLLLCSLLVLIFSLAVSVECRAVPSLSFSPSSQSVTLGSQISVAINIDGLEPGAALGTYDITVAFDAAALSFSSVAFGNQLDLFGLGDIQIVTPGPGTVNLFELSLESETDLNTLQASSFTLATVTFDTLALATNTPLTLTVNALGDAAGNPLTANIGGGLVSITERVEQVPEPSTIFLLASGAMGLFGLRSRIASARLRRLA
jgi:hypothetical protein